MYFAVVFKKHIIGFPDSHRATGGWEAFAGTTKDEAIAKALRYKALWESQGSGPYDILVAPTKECAIPNANYRLVPTVGYAKTDEELCTY